MVDYLFLRQIKVDNCYFYSKTCSAHLNFHTITLKKNFQSLGSKQTNQKISTISCEVRIIQNFAVFSNFLLDLFFVRNPYTIPSETFSLARFDTLRTLIDFWISVKTTAGNPLTFGTFTIDSFFLSINSTTFNINNQLQQHCARCVYKFTTKHDDHFGCFNVLNAYLPQLWPSTT